MTKSGEPLRFSRCHLSVCDCVGVCVCDKVVTSSCLPSTLFTHVYPVQHQKTIASRSVQPNLSHHALLDCVWHYLFCCRCGHQHRYHPARMVAATLKRKRYSRHRYEHRSKSNCDLATHHHHRCCPNLALGCRDRSFDSLDSLQGSLLNMTLCSAIMNVKPF